MRGPSRCELLLPSSHPGNIAIRLLAKDNGVIRQTSLRTVPIVHLQPQFPLDIYTGSLSLELIVGGLGKNIHIVFDDSPARKFEFSAP